MCRALTIAVALLAVLLLSMGCMLGPQPIPPPGREGADAGGAPTPADQNEGSYSGGAGAADAGASAEAGFEAPPDDGDGAECNDLDAENGSCDPSGFADAGADEDPSDGRDSGDGGGGLPADQDADDGALEPDGGVHDGDAAPDDTGNAGSLVVTSDQVVAAASSSD